MAPSAKRAASKTLSVDNLVYDSDKELESGEIDNSILDLNNNEPQPIQQHWIYHLIWNNIPDKSIFSLTGINNSRWITWITQPCSTCY